jgi:hypothetical protein
MVPEEIMSSGNTTSRSQRMTKKQQIMALYVSGITNVEDLATITQARPSYVGAVLQNAGLLRGYFDLYTSTAHPMNVYSRRFAGKLGFKDEATARHSVAVLDQLYEQFAEAGDRAGQHHALSMALVMFDRARWTGKGREADIFRQWLVAHLTPAHVAGEENGAAEADTDIDAP